MFTHGVFSGFGIPGPDGGGYSSVLLLLFITDQIIDLAVAPRLRHHGGEFIAQGVDYNDELADSYAYTSAYLPVNRLLDGTIHDW